MATRKHPTEFGIIMGLTHTMVLQQDELKRVAEFDYFDSNHPCHIYLICRRPRISIDPENFLVNSEKLEVSFKIQVKDKFRKLRIDIPNGFGTTDIKLITEYPYNSFQLLIEGELSGEFKSALFLQHSENQPSGYLDLEVLYIGQSYGVEGARTAPDRLQSHSTLQGIYSAASTKNPDYEIWLVLTSFEQLLMTSMYGAAGVDEEVWSKDGEHIKKVTKAVLDDGLKEQQVINFTEAALIRYFQPPYNIEYKESFPNPAHVTYSECYELDINSICIEMDTEDINCRLFSATVPIKWVHMHRFFLHSKADRKCMFDFDKELDLNRDV